MSLKKQFLVLFFVILNTYSVQAEVNSWQGLGPYLSSANFVTSNPGNSQIVYAALFDRGLFKSTDAGLNWEEKNNGLPIGDISRIYSIAIHPTNTQIIYLGLTYTGSDTDFLAVYKSTNAGDSWSALDAGSNNDLGVRYVSLDPNDPNKIYVGTTSKGLLVSTDAGLTWSTLNGHSEELINLSHTILNLTFDPQDNDILYAGVQLNGFYKSIDGGQSWNQLSDLAGKSPEGFVIDPNDSNLLYAITRQGFYKSTDGVNFEQKIQGMQNTRIFSLAMDPNHANVLYVGTDTSNFSESGLYKSVDSGETWTLLSGLPDLITVNSICFSPDQSLWLAVPGLGLFQSQDAGQNWDLKASGLALAAANSVSFFPDTERLLLGSDSGVLFSSDDLSNFVLSDHLLSNGEIKQVFSFSGGLAYAQGSGAIWKSEDYGISWNKISLLSTYNLAVSAQNPDILYLASFVLDSAQFSYSTNGGETWTSGSGSVNNVRSLAFDPDLTNRLFAATASGVYRMDNFDATWVPMNSGLPLNSDLWLIKIDPSNSQRIYISLLDGSFYLSSDQGNTWMQKGQGLPNKKLIDLIVHPGNQDYLFAITGDEKVYHSQDSGESFSLFSEITGQEITSLAIAPSSPYALLAGTQESGAYKMFMQECGNGILEQTESCDDANLIFGDGCSETCQNETMTQEGPGNEPTGPDSGSDNSGSSSNSGDDGTGGSATKNSGCEFNPVHVIASWQSFMMVLSSFVLIPFYVCRRIHLTKYHFGDFF